MMATHMTGNLVHDLATAKSESIRQNAVSVAAPVQASVRAADIAHYRTCLASALANGVNPGVFAQALRDLGTGGA